MRQLKVKADIVFFGDSLTYYGDFASVFPDKVVCNLGLRGDTIQGMIDRVEQVVILRPSVVYLMAGINDVACSTLNDFQTRYEYLLNTLSNIVSNESIIVQSLLPVNSQDFSISCNNSQIQQFNGLIKTEVTRLGLQYIDLYTPYKEIVASKTNTIDGIHLKKNVYEIWYSILKESSRL